METHNFSTYLTKFIQVLMHLRIDVKKQQTDHFQQLLSKKKKTEPLCNSLNQFFHFIVSQNLYDIASKALKQPQKVVSIKVVFSFVCKETQVSRAAETWYFNFEQTDIISNSSQGLVLNEVENSFQELVSLLVKLPIWERFWGNFQKRKEIKKRYNLSYRIEYNKPAKNNVLNYNRRVEKQLHISGVSTLITLEYISDLSKILDEGQADIQKTIILREKEETMRKKSLYEFYDQEFDITFVSSDSEITNNNNQEVRLVGTIDEFSDDQYQIIIDQDIDADTLLFKRTLREVAEDVDILTQKYF